MADKEVVLDVLQTRLPMLTGREKVFAEGILKFNEHKGYLTEKQINGAQKLAVRLILSEGF